MGTTIVCHSFLEQTNTAIMSNPQPITKGLINLTKVEVSPSCPSLTLQPMQRCAMTNRRKEATRKKAELMNSVLLNCLQEFQFSLAKASMTQREKQLVLTKCAKLVRMKIAQTRLSDSEYSLIQAREWGCYISGCSCCCSMLQFYPLWRKRYRKGMVNVKMQERMLNEVKISCPL